MPNVSRDADTVLKHCDNDNPVDFHLKPETYLLKHLKSYQRGIMSRPIGSLKRCREDDPFTERLINPSSRQSASRSTFALPASPETDGRLNRDLGQDERQRLSISGRLRCPACVVLPGCRWIANSMKDDVEEMEGVAV